MSFINTLRPLRRLDWSLVAAMLALLGIGIAFIFSAGYGNPDSPAKPLFLKQLCWAAMGMGFFLGFAIVDYHRWTRMAWWIYAAGLILLVLVFVPHIGLKIYGARRWLQLAGLRILQPAELMKLAAIILLARLFGWPGRNLRRWRLVLFGLVLVLIPMALIIKQPDLGTALVFMPILAGIMWASGAPGTRLAALAALGIVLAGGALALIIIPPKLGMDEHAHERLISRIGISPYQRDRIEVFLDRDRDPLGAGWNKAQSQIAVGSGRLTGKGYLQGTQNLLGFLPRTVAPNDFIFSVIAEEKGFMGGAVTLALFGVLLVAGLRAAESAADKMGRLLCVGIVTMLFCHVFVNIAMTIGLLPVTGIPLPLISYGGTFMIGTMTALGIVQSVYIRGEWR
ncbi:MAG: rod shape-determining protein RodA [Kiritimatiellota bacterium]|nr:rod shape-determining protein RodA [Kiritimatiellota bacterium]